MVEALKTMSLFLMGFVSCMIQAALAVVDTGLQGGPADWIHRSIFNSHHTVLTSLAYLLSRNVDESTIVANPVY